MAPESFRSHVESYGIEFIPYAEGDLSGITSDNPLIATNSIISLSSQLLPQVMTEINKVSGTLIVVRDQLAVWGELASRKTGSDQIVTTPLLIVNRHLLFRFWSYFMLQFLKIILQPRLLIESRRRLFRLCEDLGVEAIKLFQIPVLYGQKNVVFTWEQAQPGYGYLQRNNFLYWPDVEYNLAKRNDFTLPADLKVIYITLGTFYNDNIGLIGELLSALDMQKFTIVVSTGNKDFPSEWQELYPQVTFRKWVNQAELIPRCSLVIFSGGMNTFRDCLTHCVPMLILPIGLDQSLQAHIAKSNGWGEWLRPQNIGKNSVRLVRLIDRLSSRKLSPQKMPSEDERLSHLNRWLNLCE